MAEQNGEFAEEILSYLIPEHFSDLSDSQQIAQAKSLLNRLEAAVAEQTARPNLARGQSDRKTVSPELPQLIGDVVIAAAWAEDAAGTLLQALSGSWEVRATGYDDTSSSLLRALKAVVSKELIERLDTALKLRHFVVHGFFVDGSFVKHPTSGRPYDFVSMKRSWRTDAPEREVKAFTADALRWLALEFWEIEGELETLHSDTLLGSEGGKDA